jgi:GT2 family glycosyltransferase
VVTIIVNFNVGSLVEGCVSSLQQAGQSGFVHHIVIWENGSEHSVFGKPLESEWQLGTSTIWYIGGEGNLGYARGVNAAYKSWRDRTGLRPSAVHCANPDTVSEPDALPKLLKAVKDYGWGAAAPLVTFEHGGSRPAAYPPLTPVLVLAHFLRLRWMRRFGKRFPSTMTPREVRGAVDGAYIVFDHEAWEEVTGLDGYFGISVDDHDVCARLRSAGWKVGVVPSSRISHNGAAGRKETPLLSRLDEIQGNIRYVSKHYPRSLPFVRHGLSMLLRFRPEPLSKELAWWARKAPLAIEPLALDMEENFRRALMSFEDRPATILASKLQSEWSRRRSTHYRLPES